MLQGKKAYICSPLSAPNPEYDSKMKPGELMKVENWRSIDDEVQIYT